MVELNSARDIYSDYGYSSPKPTAGNHYNAKEFESNVVNEIATTLLNRDIEQAQWERNVAYNDPSAQYERLRRAGVGGALAAQSVAGVAGTAPQSGLVQADYESQSYGSARAANMANLVNSARGVTDAAGQVTGSLLQDAQVRNLDVQTNLMPQQIQTLQDLQRAQAWKAGQEADVVKRLADSEVSAREMGARLDEARRQLAHSQRDLVDSQIDMQHKAFLYYDKDKATYYKKCQAEIVKTYEEAKTEQYKRMQYKSQADLNSNQIKVGNAQIALMDKQGNLVSAQEFEHKVAAVEQTIRNMHLSSGAEYNYLGAGLVIDWNNAGVFDSFGRIKTSRSLMSEGTPDQNIYKKFIGLDLDSYGDAHSLARQAVVSGYINSGCQVVNSVSNAVRTGSKVIND